jgi:hypothetical protein
MAAPVLALVAGPHVAHDELFDPTSAYNRDDCLAGFRLLREALESSGGRCHTHDVYLAEGTVPDVVLHLDIPRREDNPALAAWSGRCERWAFLLESEVIAPWNWDRRRQAAFSRVFTWHDGLVDGERFYKLNHHVPFCRSLDSQASRPRQVVVMAANKRVRHRLELYSMRRSAIAWADRNRPGVLDLYGPGWDRRVPKTRVAQSLMHRTHLDRVPARPPSSYRGVADRKSDVLGQYRFSLCLENARGIPGYITEKIFDVMLAGTVPIYLGAPNVADHIPSACFIDLRQFTSWSALFDELASMTPEQYDEQRAAAAHYLDSSTARAWSAEGFAAALMEQL